MSDINIPLLRKALEWAEAEAARPANEREWDQHWWAFPVSDDDSNVIMNWEALGSSAVAHHRTGEHMNEKRAELDESCGTRYCIAGWTVHQAGELVPVWGTAASDRAQELLGLTASQADVLFDPSNSIEDIRRTAEAIAGEPL